MPKGQGSIVGIIEGKTVIIRKDGAFVGTANRSVFISGASENTFFCWHCKHCQQIQNVGTCWQGANRVPTLFPPEVKEGVNWVNDLVDAVPVSVIIAIARPAKK